MFQCYLNLFSLIVGRVKVCWLRSSENTQKKYALILFDFLIAAS